MKHTWKDTKLNFVSPEINLKLAPLWEPFNKEI